MRSAAAESTELLYYQFQDEHWTTAGNRVIAQALAQGLRERKLVPAEVARPAEGGTKRGD